MAAPGQSINPISFSGRGGGGNHASTPLAALLPYGPCSYRDLTAGSKAPTCGCKRFWLNNSDAVTQDSERAWCFCGHHACFHDIDVRPQLMAQAVESSPRRAPENLANASHQLLSVPAPHTGLTLNVSDGFPRDIQHPTGLGIRNASPSQSQSINTRLWLALNGFARGQADGKISGDTSKLPSTAVPSVIDEQEPCFSAAVGAQTPQHRLMAPPVTIPTGQQYATQAEEYSATEVATPSISGTPDLKPSAAVSAGMGGSPGEASFGQAQKTTPRQGFAEPMNTEQLNDKAFESTTNPLLSLQEIRNTIQNYGHRLSALENFSFSHMPSDEVLEKFDLVDGRLLDLEHWRTAIDKGDHTINQKSASEKPSNTKRRRLFADETDSLASDGSFDSNAAMHTEAAVLATLAANAETRPRIDALEARIEDLETAALPSFARPWHVQVVLLPYGRQLPGIWFSSGESTQQSMKSMSHVSEEWTGPHQSTTLSFNSSTAAGTWTTESIRAWANETQDEWLSPKACGPNGTVFQRLSSRGLVRDVVIDAPDAHHILDLISNAFGNVLEKQDITMSEDTDRFRGLKEPFLPLRKVRKSSRLRFLSPAEVVTSATWTADFFESSIFMRVGDGHRRLYITTPEAYLQSSATGWAWPMIKKLPVSDGIDPLQAAQIYDGALEACWTYNERFDYVPSLHSSFATQASAWSTRSQNSDHTNEESADDRNRSSFKARAVQTRSISLPSSASTNIVVQDALPKRRIASFDTVGRTTNFFPIPPEYTSKRRRISNSPGLERNGVNLTPATSNRYSREPPSPGNASGSTGLAFSQLLQQQYSGVMKRGNTPFAYATPHSNLDSRPDDIATEPDTERFTQDEWEGVQDGPHTDHDADSPGASLLSDHFDDDDDDDDDDNIDGSDEDEIELYDP